MFASVNGTKIFFDIEGKQVEWDEKMGCMKEKPVCFILHGGPGGDHYIYGTFFRWLTEYMQLIYIDYRGNGRSDRTGDPTLYTIKQNVEDLEALRKYLGLDKIVVMGQSYGGIMSQAYATTYPENVSAAILLCTAPSHELFDKASEQVAIRATPEMQQFFQEVVVQGKLDSDEAFLKYLVTFAPLYTLHKPEVYAQEVKRTLVSYQAYANGAKDMADFDFRPDLHKITCPTLLMGGDEDFITPIDQTHVISEQIKDCKTVVVPDSSHEIFLDQPEFTRNVLNDFVVERIVPLTKYLK